VTDRTAAFVDALAGRNLIAALEFHPFTLTHTAASTNHLLDTLHRPNLRTHWQPDPTLAVEATLAELTHVASRLAHVHVFAWGPEGIADRHPLDDGAALWHSALAIADSDTGSLPSRRYALCEYVRDDDPDQLVVDVRTLRRWIEEIEESSDERTRSL
jgi:hypothetical protein